MIITFCTRVGIVKEIYCVLNYLWVISFNNVKNETNSHIRIGISHENFNGKIFHCKDGQQLIWQQILEILCIMIPFYKNTDSNYWKQRGHTKLIMCLESDPIKPRINNLNKKGKLAVHCHLLEKKNKGKWIDSSHISL